MLVDELFEATLPDLRPRLLVLKTAPETPGALRLIDGATRELVGLIRSPADFMRLINPQQKQHGADLVIKVPPQVYQSNRSLIDNIMRFGQGMAQEFQRKITFDLQGANGNRLAEDTLRLGGFDVKISPHVADQAKKRGVPTYLINTLLCRLKKVKNTIKDMDPHQQFKLLDTETGVALGMMRSSEDTDRLLFNTVMIYDERPGRDPVIRIR